MLLHAVSISMLLKYLVISACGDSSERFADSNLEHEKFALPAHPDGILHCTGLSDWLMLQLMAFDRRQLLYFGSDAQQRTRFLLV